MDADPWQERRSELPSQVGRRVTARERGRRDRRHRRVRRREIEAHELMIAADRIAEALERHRVRREIHVPTVTALVGPPRDGVAAWQRWCAASARQTLRAEGDDAAAIVRQWTAAVLEGQDLVGLVATALSQATGSPSQVAAYRLREERHAGTSDLLDALASRDAFFQGVCEALVRPPAGFDELWTSLTTTARSFGHNVGSITAVLGELIGWHVVPSIALDATVTGTEPAAAERLEKIAVAAAKIAELAPLLPVAIFADVPAWSAYERTGVQRHAKDLVLAGLIRVETVRSRVSGDERGRSVETARAVLAEAKARPSDSAADARARSAAERLVHQALQANSYTRDHFELNGTMDVFFGTKRLEVDLLDRECAIALEIDGYFHFRNADAYRRDRSKDLLMQQNGYLVIRTLAEDAVEGLDELVARIVNLVLERRHAATDRHDV
jgi:very-short-patch-repair endonuclease